MYGYFTIGIYPDYNILYLKLCISSEIFQIKPLSILDRMLYIDQSSDDSVIKKK
jgi:hypothetical protein